jgi:Glyoxalase/Bleomycin resistance protein/Dioxygenase superfamily
MAFAGHMQIELIQPLDDNPSVYRDGIAVHGFGFHHIGIACDDVEAEIPTYEAKGYALDFLAAVPTGGLVAYMRPPAGAAPGYVELIPTTAGMDAHFTQFWRAAQDWDGKDPVRPFM